MNTRRNTPEQQTADTTLQHTIDITAGSLRYKVKPPTTATLIEASAEISHLPVHEYNKEDNILIAVLRTAKDMRDIARPLAAIIVGAKAPAWWRPLARYHYKKKLHAVATELLYNLTNEQMRQLAMQLFASLNVSDFFALTAFLSEVNITKPTKADRKTTASGAR